MCCWSSQVPPHCSPPHLGGEEHDPDGCGVCVEKAYSTQNRGRCGQEAVCDGTFDIKRLVAQPTWNNDSQPQNIYHQLSMLSALLLNLHGPTFSLHIKLNYILCIYFSWN